MPTPLLFNSATSKSSSLKTVAWAAFATFSTYFCMYGFRKAISATTFDGFTALGISLKSALVIAQVLGYMVSKFIGIKFIAELNKAKRGQYILLLLGTSHLCLLFLAIFPLPLNILFMFFNGMSLGLIWGLVFSYIEGRRFTDFLALVLSTNFIFSSGAVKSIGRISIEKWNIPELYMPFFVGLLFMPLLLLSVWMLNKIPPPSEEETKSRGVRVPLNGTERVQLFKKFRTGLVLIIIVNLILTILRDLKDNYAVEILRLLKPSFNAAIFTQMETTAAISVFFLLIFLAAFRNHYKSIVVHQFAITAGMLLIILAAWFLRQGVTDPVITLVLYTIGLYVCYNTLQCLFLDRFIAAFSIKANIGFFFYLMDSIGYLGSCFVILNKELFNSTANWLLYFIQTSLVLGAMGLVSIIVSAIYFAGKHKEFQAKPLIHISPDYAKTTL